MKSPFTDKEMTLRVRNEVITFRKEQFTVSYPSYYCEDSDKYFTTTEFDTIKMKQVYNKYRDLYNLPFPEEIKEIRSKYGLSASKMSEILGFGINSYRNYENGEVPNQSNASLIQMVKDPSKFKSLVEISSYFEEDSKEKNELLKKINRLIGEELQNKFLAGFEDYLLGNKLPDNFSGYLKPNIKKLTEMVVYFAKTMTPYVTKLNKLLFYSDFTYYKTHAVSISGTRYRAIDKGPVPNNYNSIYDFINSTNAIEIVEREYDWGYSKQFIANREFDSNLFSEDEIKMLKKVSDKFKETTTSEIVDISHTEEAWIKNYKNGKSLIDYNEFAFTLKHLS